MFYFAYGSNMRTARLAERVPTVSPVGPGWLSGHRLYFHLRGSDGSGKCNILATGDPDDRVHGVVFELDERRLDRLHAAEGRPYAFVELEIGTAEGPVVAATYRGRKAYLDDSLRPFDWYGDFVVEGAKEHGLPRDWIDWLAGHRFVPDPDARRGERNRRIGASTPTNVVGRPGQ